MLKKFVCVVAILGMAGVVNAAIDWKGTGDGTTFGQAANWGGSSPSGQSWAINKTGVGTPGNWNIHVTADITTMGATLYNYNATNPATYVATVTVDANKNLQLYNAGGSAELIMERGQRMIVKPGASVYLGPTFATADQQLNLGSTGPAYLKIESGGSFSSGYLRHDNGSVLDLYGTYRTYYLTRISADPGYALNVYNGGMLIVEQMSTYSASAWGKSGKVTMFKGSTVQVRDNKSSIYTNYVMAGETGGTWEVDYNVTRAGYTTIKYVPEPATALFLLAGLPLLRRRRA